LHGAARRTRTALVPYYNVFLGGKTAEGSAQLAEHCGAIPAKRVPDFLVDLLQSYCPCATDPTDFRTALERLGSDLAKQVVARHQADPDLEAGTGYHSDWGS
jgi:sulfite reductase (ferredoxin)